MFSPLRVRYVYRRYMPVNGKVIVTTATSKRAARLLAGFAIANGRDFQMQYEMVMPDKLIRAWNQSQEEGGNND